MITWPEGLPKPSVDWNITDSTSVARTKMDSGRFRQRKRFTRDFRQMKASWKLTDAEYGYFQSIYHGLLGSGADWFLATLPMGDALKQYTVRFVADSYAAKYDDVMHWTVTAALETEDETAPWAGDDLDALMASDFSVDSMELSNAALHVYVHVILPTLLPA